jgi:hypothetical protein
MAAVPRCSPCDAMNRAETATVWGSACIICGSPELIDVLTTPPVPILCNQLLYDPARARDVARAAIVLVGCRRCGHVFNRAFDASAVRYDRGYENSLMGSPRYQEYTAGIIDRLFAARDLRGGTVVEIGCGRGEFMRMLCERGMSRGVGFDPGQPDGDDAVGDARVSIIGSPFDRAAAPQQTELVCARHVLEHLPDPVSLLASLRSVYESRPQCMLLLEVPNGCYTLEQLGIWDLIYEHVSYFTHPSLSWGLAAAGLSLDRITTTFGGQFLLAEAAFDRAGPSAAFPKTVPETVSHFAAFGAEFSRTVNDWKRWLDTARQSGRRIALWGAGSKGSTFLNLTDWDDDRSVTQVVDVNPRKAGAFVAGTGHPIGPPEALRYSRPNTILLMNPEYQGEVRRLLQSLGVPSEVIAVSGNRLPIVKSVQRKHGSRCAGPRS